MKEYGLNSLTRVSQGSELLCRNLHFIGGLTYGSVFGELVMLGVQATNCMSARDSGFW